MSGRPWGVLAAAAGTAALVVAAGRLVAARLPAPAGPGTAALMDAGLTIALFGLLALAAAVGTRRAGLAVPGWGPRAAAMAGLGGGVGLALLLAALADAALAGTAHRVAGHGAWGLLLLGTVAVAVQAGAEEWFFRGWVQGALARDWQPPAAIGAAALLFALLHLVGGARAPASLLNILLAGLVFGTLRWRSGGLAAPVAAHIAYNWAETLLFGLDPNPGTGPYGALVDLDLAGSAWWGGSGEGLNASAGLGLALAAALLPLALAWRPAPARA